MTQQSTVHSTHSTPHQSPTTDIQFHNANISDSKLKNKRDVVVPKSQMRLKGKVYTL